MYGQQWRWYSLDLCLRTAGYFPQSFVLLSPIERSVTVASLPVETFIVFASRFVWALLPPSFPLICEIALVFANVPPIQSLPPTKFFIPTKSFWRRLFHPVSFCRLCFIVVVQQIVTCYFVFDVFIWSNVSIVCESHWPAWIALKSFSDSISTVLFFKGKRIVNYIFESGIVFSNFG